MRVFASVCKPMSSKLHVIRLRIASYKLLLPFRASFPPGESGAASAVEGRATGGGEVGILSTPVVYFLLKVTLGSTTETPTHFFLYPTGDEKCVMLNYGYERTNYVSREFFFPTGKTN